MSFKSERVKLVQEKCQTVLNELLRDDDNKYCVDCDSKGPRWASWNLGVFLCIRCAGIHRNLGVHISKVKSVNLDAWTPEQVVSLQHMGNSRARAVYEANLPDNFRRPQNDTNLESFIRAKYEHKKYIAREWVPPTLPKVDWEKEVTEEYEKQKRKKKTVVDKKIVNSVEVPTLPKPKNPSPKPGRSVQSTPPVVENKQNDLLGLQNGEDNFSGFVSAPAKEEKQKTEEEIAKSEEESFFNQTAPLEKEKVKLTKDSILALYGNAPTNTFNSVYQVPVNQVPYQQQAYPTQNNFQNFNAFPHQNFPVQNGISQFPAANQVQYPVQPVGQQWGGANVQYVQGQQPQFATSGQFQPATQFPQNAQFQSAQLGQYPLNASSLGQQTTPNPFFATQGLSQQFGGLNLGSATSGGVGAAPTLAGNLWQ